MAETNRTVAWPSGLDVELVLLIGLMKDFAGRSCFSVWVLIGCHVINAAVTMFSLVEVYKAIHQDSRREKILKAARRLALVVNHRAKL